MVFCVTVGIGGFLHHKSLQDKRLQCFCIRPPLGLSSHSKSVHAIRVNDLPRCKPSRSSVITSAAVSEPKEEHKIFDEVVLAVRAGNGGCGEIVDEGKGKMVKNHKYQRGRQLKKNIWLNASPPASGASGADVIIQCSSHVDSLVHLHGKNLYTASSGANGNPEEGSQAPKRIKRVQKSTSPLKIQVPPGTVVKRGSGRFIGEVLDPGEELLVARGGKGGMGVVRPSKKSKDFGRKKVNRLRASGVDVIEIEDENWKVDSFGAPGEEVSLHLLLRIVADAGFVGLPNAGKSSLLASLTRARPEIAAYPFTTLIPNLGVMGKGGDPVLVDLPGLIEGAHVGKGLGRKFLQHLRRTRALLQVVDGSTPDPIADFVTIREELRMYNPDYCARPYVVALNKMDLEEASCRKDELVSGVHEAAVGLQNTVESAVMPTAIVPVSALEDTGVAELRVHIDNMVAMTEGDYKNVSELLKATDEGLEDLADFNQESSWA